MSCVPCCVAILSLLQSPGETAAPRPPHELRAAIHAALRSSAATAQPDPRVETPKLIALYKEVRADTQLDQDDRLYFQGLLRTRLQAMSKKLAAERPAPAQKAAVATAARAKHVVPPGGGILAQQGMQPPQGQPGGGGGGAAGGFPPYDYSQQLIDLIQQTIAPTTWDVNGGQGSIRYYRPLHVLVIRQTGEVHGRIGGVMNGLRK